MKILLFVLISFMLIGCWSDISIEDINTGIKTCKNNEGLKKMEVDDLLYNYIICKNGAKFKLTDKLRKK